ncbi:acylneuraminate cytidylyltransferase family protein [uncultured Photobacterium sp.]|uniref:acylneuraminate cytidylyltransferase family protein n=1 Tax=uncultured Photobacterium sp. TaxID=173973 RepID=UPI00261EE40D|nr:acylneuraminate cytidylyltransferase family protein [uncultured Photobacterium sp.]
MLVAIITARGGSKGLPRKNILPLKGTPLIGWTINAALESNCVDLVYVTTDDEEIASVSKQCGASVIPRPAELAQDTMSSEPVIQHAIEWLASQDIHPDSFALLQPTSPLRTSKHIDEAFHFFQESNAQCVISVFEPSHTPIKAYVETQNGTITGLYGADAPYTRRQDLPRAFQPNGALYIFDRESFMCEAQIPRENVFPYIMSESDSADIDTQEDLNRVEQLLKAKYD